MELWVRSQDKMTMLKANEINIIDYRGLKEKLEKSVVSFLSEMEQVKEFTDKDGWGLRINETCMGIYDTKERALEVLNEIQRHLVYLNIEVASGRACELDFESDIVYEMPKE